MKTIGLDGAVDSFEMHDALGNTCAAALFTIGPDRFEVYFWDFNSSVPRRIVESQAVCQSSFEAFFRRKVSEGFIEPLADVNGKAVRS